jgi:[protein-PII] uridylyltransferase
VPFDRGSLAHLRYLTPPTWDVWQRAAFLRLLRAGSAAVPVFEALDHEGVLVTLLPEWEHVRSLPQRNAYHRFTVDRHLLEAVAECARLLDAGDSDGPVNDVDAIVARACRRPELLLLGALLHDVAKGRPGDHSEVGARRPRRSRDVSA